MSDRVVFDCMIYLQAALRPERSRATMQAMRADRLSPYLYRLSDCSKSTESITPGDFFAVTGCNNS